MFLIIRAFSQHLSANTHTDQRDRKETHGANKRKRGGCDIIHPYI